MMKRSVIQVRDRTLFQCLVYSYIIIDDTCEPGTFRLSGRSSPGEGLVEVCSGGSFSSICLEEVQLPDSVDVCRSLGFPGGK